MQQRVERAWPDAVVVVPEFLHHRKPEDVLVRCVNEDMNANQTGKEFPLMLKHNVTIPR